MSTGLAVGGALGSALCFAVSSVLQQRGASRAPLGSGLHLGLLAHLVARPIWLVGLLAAAGTLVLQTVALAAGPLSLVQPLLVCGLLFALPVSVLLEGRRPSLVEWAWAAMLVFGLALFLWAARPAPGPALPDDGRLLELGGAAAVLGLTAACVGYGPGRRHRAVLLGVATGIMYGLTASLVKYTVAVARDDVTDLFTTWPAYVLVILGGGAILLNQAAFQAGPLAGALPTTVVMDTIVAIVIAVAAFGERVRTEPAPLTLQVVGFLAMAFAIFRLARLASGRGPLTGGLVPV